MSKFDVNKMMIEATLAKVLKDLKADPEKTLRKLAERKDAHAKTQSQQELLEKLQAMLQNPNSAYRLLIKRLVHQVQTERLKTFLMNLGYHGLTAGTKTIRNQELVYGFHIPWTISFALDQKVTATHVDGLIQQGKQLGIYIYQLHCKSDQAVFDLPQLLSQHKDCAFIVYLKPKAITEELLEQLGKQYHVMLSLACHDNDADEVFAKLKQKGFLYSVHFEYDETNVQRIFGGEWIEYAESMGAMFALTWPKKQVERPLREQVYQYILFQRLEQRQAVIPIELVRDSLDLDRLLSKEEAVLSFDGNGQRIKVESSDERGEENLLQMDLIQILEKL